MEGKVLHDCPLEIRPYRHEDAFPSIDSWPWLHGHPVIS
jgi:hypothetical protein